MNDDVKKVFITYEEYGKLIVNLSNMLKLYNYYDYIIGLPRGGLPIAVHLSHQLQIPMADINYLPYKKDAKIILVDDILDTGKTMEDAIEMVCHLNIVIAVLHWKPHSSITPDMFAKQTTDWITYPWERDDEKPNRKMYAHL